MRFANLGLFLIVLSVCLFGHENVRADKDPAPTTQETHETITWGDPTAGCRIGVVGVKGSYVAGEAVDIQITVKNEGSKNIVLYNIQGPVSEQFNPSGTQTDGSVIAKTEYARHPRREGSDALRWLEPNNLTASRTLRVNRSLDLSRSGIYEITISTTIAKENEEKLITVNSKPIKIEIIDPEK